MHIPAKPGLPALLFAIVLVGSSVSQSQNFDPPSTFGEVIGGQIADIYVSVRNARQATQASTELIERARQKYFACYPDCPELEARRKAFADLLGEKDWNYLTLSLATHQDVWMGGSGQNIHAIGTLAGSIDGGIHSTCASDFDTWTAAVYEAMGGGVIAFKIGQLMPALQASNKHYEKYVVCRDKREFEKHFGLAETTENHRLRRSALVAVDRYFKFQGYDPTEYPTQDRKKIAGTIRRLAEDNVHVLMCEYGPYENTSGSIDFWPYRIMEAWYKSPPTNLEEFERVREHPGSHIGKEAMVCCPETSNDFFAVRTGKAASAGCQAPPPSIKSSMFFWGPFRRAYSLPYSSASLTRTGFGPDRGILCTYDNGEKHNFTKEELDKAWRGKCPEKWAPELYVDREVLDSGDVRYTLTNGEAIVLPNGYFLEYWIPDETTWWRLGDPYAVEKDLRSLDGGGSEANAPKVQSDGHASTSSDNTNLPDRTIASETPKPRPDAPAAAGKLVVQDDARASESSAQPSPEIDAEASEQLIESKQEVDFDVIGIELGMSLQEAQAIARGHMAATSVYRNERPSESNYYPFGEKPFARAVTYLRLRDEPEQRVASAEEIITLMVERSKSGHDEVLGIRRLVSMSKSTNPDAVAALLAKKYGQPASEQKSRSQSSWSWGKVDKRYCQPSISELNLGAGELESGQMVSSFKLRKLPVGSVGTTSTSWMKLPDDTRFRSCGPALRAQFRKGKLEVLLTDLNRYFARFEELFVTSSEEEAPELELSL